MKSSTYLLHLLQISFFIQIASSCSPCNCQNVRWISLDGQTYYTGDCDYTTIQKHINFIPDSMDTSIEVIDMLDQSLDQLDEKDLTRYTNLKYLRFNKNNIKYFDKNTFKSTRKLKYLKIVTNNIESLPTELFSHTVHLTGVWFGHNKIKILQNNLFANLPELKQIYLNDNEITIIESKCFTTLPALETLDLQSNSLKTLYLDFHNDFGNLKSLLLDKNPWECNNNICDLIKFATSRKLWGTYPIPTCTNKNEKRWDLLGLEDFSPSIVSNSTSIEEGEDFFIDCKYCFVSNISWNFNRLKISNIYHKINYKSTVSTIFLDNVRKIDSGNYMCHVENCENCQNASVYVKVLEKVATSTENLYSNTEVSSEDYTFTEIFASASSIRISYILLLLMSILLQIMAKQP